MPLFEVIGTTPCKTVFPIAFGLASSESQEAFTWLARQLRDLFKEIGLQLTGDARQIHVIITDDDRGMKAALSEVFPDIQQQLCRWHIQKNALKNLAEKWVRSDTPARGGGLGEVVGGVVAVGNVLGGGLLISANEIIEFCLALPLNVEALKRPRK